MLAGRFAAEPPAAGQGDGCRAGRDRTRSRALARYDRGMPYVYLLRCRDGSLYAGAAMDLERRLREHRAGLASRYTRSRLPVELAWRCEVGSWSAALREERRIKRLRRPAKEALIAGGG
jgi:putative endonuclease